MMRQVGAEESAISQGLGMSDLLERLDHSLRF